MITSPAERIAKAVRQLVRDEFDEPRPHENMLAIASIAERALIVAVLEHCQGNQTRTAAALGINRNTLRKMVRNYRVVL